MLIEWLCSLLDLWYEAEVEVDPAFCVSFWLLHLRLLPGFPPPHPPVLGWTQSGSEPTWVWISSLPFTKKRPLCCALHCSGKLKLSGWITISTIEQQYCRVMKHLRPPRPKKHNFHCLPPSTTWIQPHLCAVWGSFIHHNNCICQQLFQHSTHSIMEIYPNPQAKDLTTSCRKWSLEMGSRVSTSFQLSFSLVTQPHFHRFSCTQHCGCLWGKTWHNVPPLSLHHLWVWLFWTHKHVCL